MHSESETRLDRLSGVSQPVHTEKRFVQEVHEQRRGLSVTVA